jgi:FdhD protein
VPPTIQTTVTRVHEHATETVDDCLAVEEPLEIRCGERPLAVTMRTPGDDYDLALGFLITEGIVQDANDVDGIRHWGSPNVVRVALREGVNVDWTRLQRHFYASSSCGICGKASIDAVRVQTSPLEDGVRVSADVIASLPEVLRAGQATFASTGAIHATGAFLADGTLLNVREDVGRHNAVDKSIGALRRDGQHADLLAVSGRAGFEVVQKCIVARIAVIVAVGAPSSLAVELAQEMNLTLIGFVRDGRFNVYSGGGRLVSRSDGVTPMKPGGT